MVKVKEKNGDLRFEDVAKEQPATGILLSVRTGYSLTAILLFIMVIIVVTYHANDARLFAADKALFTIENPELAYEIWSKMKVQGRVLLLFDNYPHMRGFADYDGIPRLDRSNLIEFCLFQNIIRKIYFIVPDQDWEKFRQQQLMHPLRKVAGVERGFYLYSLSGILIIATTPSSLPHIAEETLVYINDRIFDYDTTLDLLSRKWIVSDIIIRYHHNNT
jgi:hypothetical protein